MCCRSTTWPRPSSTGRPNCWWAARRTTGFGATGEALAADLRSAGAANEVLRRELRLDGAAGARLWDTRFVSLPTSAGAREQVLLVASDVTEQRAEAQARFEAAIAQREMLVKEVHHRIKNNLQGVAGLLQQNAARHPEVAAILTESVGQVQAIAQVYGLQVGAGGPLRVASVLEAIALSVQRTFGRAVRVHVDGDEPARMLLPEAESIPIALTINELLTNAVKHSAQGEVHCGLSLQGEDVRLAIRKPGRLREGFSLAQFPGGVSGLGLVRALLPRRSATLTLSQQGDEVLTEVVAQAAQRATRAAPDRRGRPARRTVCARMPVLATAARHSRRHPMNAKGKILVVDDDRLVLATVTHGLAQAGYEVIDADNGDDAILLARKHRPELALLDIRMEGKSGFDVAEYLRDFCHIPFMFLSAFADPDTVAKVAELGAVAYMVKPLDVGQIVPTVDAAFERLRAQRARPRPAQGTGRAAAGPPGRRGVAGRGRADAPLFAVARRCAGAAGAALPMPPACRWPSRPSGWSARSKNWRAPATP